MRYGTGLALVARLDALRPLVARDPGTLRGRQRHLPSLCVTASFYVATSSFVLRGRRGTYGSVLAWWRAWSPLVRGAVVICMVGMALGDIYLHFVWHAWHLATSSFDLRRRRSRGAAAICVVGVALGDIYLKFVWQVRHLATSTFTLRGKRCKHGTFGGLLGRPERCGPFVAGKALGDIYLHFA